MSSSAPVSSTDITIPDQLIGPSLCDHIIHGAEIVGRTAGGALCGGGSIYFGVHGFSPYLVWGSASVSVLLFTLQIVDMTCGRGNTMAKLFNQASKTYVFVLNQFKSDLKKFDKEQKEQEELIKREDKANEKLATLMGEANADSAKMLHTVEETGKTVAHLDSVSIELNKIVKEDGAQNQALAEEIHDFTQKISSLNHQVQKASDAIPELKSIDLRFEQSVSSFKQKADKILSAFQTIVTQITSHAGVVATLKQEIAELKENYNRVEQALNGANKENKALQLEINKWRDTSENIGSLREELSKLEKKLEQEQQELKERKAHFEAEREEWNRRRNELKKTEDQIESTSSELKQYIARNKQSCDEHLRMLQALEEGDNS